MSMLTHPLLLSLSKLVDKQQTALKWIDLYAAQFIADGYSADSAQVSSYGSAAHAKAKKQHAQAVNLDLFECFDEQAQDEIVLKKADVIVLALMCSQVVSQGLTHLDLHELPRDILGSAKLCGYQPSFQSSEQLISGLRNINRPRLVRVITCTHGRDDESNRAREAAMPLDDVTSLNNAPLVLWQNKLYLAKYWLLHQSFELWLQSRSEHVANIDSALAERLAISLKSVFSLDSSEGSDINWQAVAAAHTLIHPFSLITGGPGTGKTTTAASLLFLLMRKRQIQREQILEAFEKNGASHSALLPDEKLHVRLLAPTGKAAVKLADSIRHQLKQIEARLQNSDVQSLRMSNCLPETGETVHRFLYEMGGLRDSFSRPKGFNTEELLQKRSKTDEDAAGQVTRKPLDVIIVDESSMMDLALMVELVSLIPAHTQVILLGDHYQLPAVDPGQIFTECVQRFSTQAQTPASLVGLSTLTGYALERLNEFEAGRSAQASLAFQPLCSLRKTYRFGGDLKTAAEQIKTGAVRPFIKQFWSESESFKPEAAVTWHSLVRNERVNYDAIVNGYSAYFDAVAKRAELDELSTLFERYQLLCSTLEGPLGVHFLNQYIEQRYHHACFPNGRGMTELYHGKAVLVTRNHPHLGVYNGDIGFVIADEQTSNLNVNFPVPNHEPIIVPPARIKEWQTAYAMTVHKSQGSEYQHVGVVMADYAKELLSRALLYTALTRSKQSCEIWSEMSALEQAFED